MTRISSSCDIFKGFSRDKLDRILADTKDSYAS